MADDDKKKLYIAPNGLAIVKLTTHRYGVHNPGEVCGLPVDDAQQLVDKGFATVFVPEAEKPAPAAAPAPAKK